jgi:hypothetical protein
VSTGIHRRLRVSTRRATPNTTVLNDTKKRMRPVRGEARQMQSSRVHVIYRVLALMILPFLPHLPGETQPSLYERREVGRTSVGDLSIRLENACAEGRAFGIESSKTPVRRRSEPRRDTSCARRSARKHSRTSCDGFVGRGVLQRVVRAESVCLLLQGSPPEGFLWCSSGTDPPYPAV